MNIEKIIERLRCEYDVHNDCYEFWANKDTDKELYAHSEFDKELYLREINYEEGFCMGLGFALDLIREEMEKEA